METFLLVVSEPLHQMKPFLLSNKTGYDWESLQHSYQNYVTPTATVLEIGASNLDRTKEINRFCIKFIGIELFPERKPNNFENVNYLIGDWQYLSNVVLPQSIDLAISSHVIEHVPDDLKAINELYTVLKPGGIALINTPNRKRLTRAIVETFTKERIFPHQEHQREYTEKDLHDLLNRSLFKNFKIIPVVFGICSGPISLYIKNVPHLFKKYANFWEIHLFKKKPV